VDLCAEGVSVAASPAADARRTASSWGRAVGLQAAVNGDFFRTDTARPVVYGLAVGDGMPWPAVQTGEHANYDDDWYHRRYGWIAFLDDGAGVEFDHTRWTKRNVEVASGFHGARVDPTLPDGVVALVSGFPEVVTEGARVRCDSPTADTCFPDRSDMRARHPRTAMGLTEDRRTFILAVADGRSAASAGMYGTELGWLMAHLGAWQAFNLDGGGSSQMWIQGEGTVNDPSDGSPRSVANHWGIRASGRGPSGNCPAPAADPDAEVPDAEVPDADVPDAEVPSEGDASSPGAPADAGARLGDAAAPPDAMPGAPDAGPAPVEIGPTNPGPASDADPDAPVDAGDAGYAYDPFADGVDPEADADDGGGGCSAVPAAPAPWLPALALLGLVYGARRARRSRCSWPAGVRPAGRRTPADRAGPPAGRRAGRPRSTSATNRSGATT
jgi:hypothetical protein